MGQVRNECTLVGLQVQGGVVSDGIVWREIMLLVNFANTVDEALICLIEATIVVIDQLLLLK